jgi:hypothetical protein
VPVVETEFIISALTTGAVKYSATCALSLPVHQTIAPTDIRIKIIIIAIRLFGLIKNSIFDSTHQIYQLLRILAE